MNGGTNTAAKEAGGGPGRAGFQPSGSHLGAGHVERVRRVRRRFVEGDEVLHEGHDGLVYLGIVVEVDCDERQCLVRFGDCTEKWSPFYDLRRLDHGGDDEEEEEDEEEDEGRSSSCFNAGDEDDFSNYDFDDPVFRELNNGKHGRDEDDDEDDIPLNAFKIKKKIKKKKRKGTVEGDMSAQAEKMEKKKRRRRKSKPLCTSMPPPKTLPPPPKHVLEARKELPYDFEKLVWDDNHLWNTEDRYCYCGEYGDWYKKMFQCRRCLQWFHQECVRKSTTPLLFGDRFFEFVCVLCTGNAEESIRRLDLNWVDALHLVLFNLTVVKNKNFHDLETSIVPFLKSKWKNLQGPGCLLKSSRVDAQRLHLILSGNKSRFKCGSEMKKRSTLWGLRKREPPPVPQKYGLINTASSIVNYRCRMKAKVKVNVVLTKSKHPLSGGTRGRPPKHSINKKSRHDSLENSPGCESDDDDGSSSRGTLDSFIPPPKNFEGFNNPFRNLGIGPFHHLHPQHKAMQKTQPPSSHLPASSEANTAAKLACPLLPSPPKQTSASDLLMIVRDPINVDEVASMTSQLANSSNCNANGNENGDGDSAEKSSPNGKFLSDLKCSLNSYFGAETRIAKGEKFNVTARRLNLDGDVQYLLEWEQPNPLSPVPEKSVPPHIKETSPSSS